MNQQTIGDFYARRARDLFREGYNCSQAVVAAFAEPLGIEFETALLLGSSFGGGMGRLRESCGAVNGMLIVAGLKHGYIDPDDYEAKREHYVLVQKLVKQFKEKYGTIQCRTLLGGNASDSPIPTPRTLEFYAKRPCEKIIGECAKIVADELFAEDF